MTGRGPSPEGDTPPVDRPPACVVQLCYATLPHCLRAIAVHSWFVVWDPAARRWHRWEVWQTKDAGGQSFGHVHCDLKPPYAGVGGGPSRLAAVWHGRAARTVGAVLTRARAYPYRDRYRAWPGPNSNTFAAWVLREAGVAHAFEPRAIGKDYSGRCGLQLTPRPARVQLETPVLGVRLSPSEGAEVHVLGFTWGLRWSPLAVDTPFGRLGRRNMPDPACNACPDPG